jgi:hypothetical protein
MGLNRVNIYVVYINVIILYGQWYRTDFARRIVASDKGLEDDYNCIFPVLQVIMF